MKVNWILLGLLMVTVLGGVGIGLICAPLRYPKTPTTFVVIRAWSDPKGLEILYESRSQKAATDWYVAHKHEYGEEAPALSVRARDVVDAYNVRAMAEPDFWRTIDELGTAWAELQSARGTIESLRGELHSRSLPLEFGEDPSRTIDAPSWRRALSELTDTAEMILAEIHRLADGATTTPLRIVAPTELLTKAAINAALPAEPAPATVLKPTSKPNTQTVVLQLGEKGVK